VHARLILVVGPSGAGKDTLIQWARGTLGVGLPLCFVEREITRACSPHDRHVAVTDAEFDQRLRAQTYLLSWSAHGVRYGIGPDARAALERGQSVVCIASRTVLDTARQLPWPVSFVEIRAPYELLQQRLIARDGRAPEEIPGRLARAETISVEGDDVHVIDNGGALTDSGAAFNSLLSSLVSREVSMPGEPTRALWGIDRLQRMLLGRCAVGVIIAVAGLLMLPSVLGPFALDDHIFEVLERPAPGIAGLHSRPWDLLTFTTGDVVSNRALIDEGALLPWWSHEHHLNSLLRPLSVLTHRIDLALWPHSAALAHLHSILWFVGLLCALSLLYGAINRELWVGRLALLLFAFDDVHGATVGWIANRNAILAALFGALGLWLHHRGRNLQRPADRVSSIALSALCVALSLASAESGVIVYAYLFAYAVCMDRARGLRSALIALWPFVPVALLWRWIYKAGGYGTFASDAYLDPAQAPLTFLRALSRNLPALLGSQLGPGLPLADAMFWAPLDQTLPVQLLSWLTLLVMGVLLLPTLLSSPASRFWALSLVLGAVPLSASALGDRLLLPIGIAGSALVAQAIAHWVGLARDAQVGLGHVMPRIALVMLVLPALVVSPLLLPMRASLMGLLGVTLERAQLALPHTPDVRDKSLVIVNAPLDVAVSYIQIARAREGVPRPAHLRWLATASSTFSVQRLSERVLRVHKDKGLLYTAPERHYRAASLGFARGDQVRLSDMTARIVALTQDGRPQTVDFRFDERLEAQRYLFYVWRGTRFVPWALPRIGESRSFGAEDMGVILARDWLGVGS
jgi:phosphonate metabolism protein PhnN/1,5-bisphosphokinase (PRPP-forming)